MSCYYPIDAWYDRVLSNGERSIVFDRKLAWRDSPKLELPCGQCIGCKLARSREWAMRIMHEKKMHAASAFLTLTYSEDRLPSGGSLAPADLRNFMKRLRKRRPQGLRFFACGEYGEKLGRPHYHVLLLNTSFDDLKRWRKSPSGNQLYVSAELSDLWDLGHSEVGDVTIESAQYCAKYCIKKITGDGAAAHYGGRVPEFVRMSNRPGIGFTWFAKYFEETYKHDSAIVNGVEVKPPRYYDKKYKESVDAKRLEKLKYARKRKAKMHAADNTPERRKVRARFDELKLAHFDMRKI